MLVLAEAVMFVIRANRMGCAHHQYLSVATLEASENWSGQFCVKGVRLRKVAPAAVFAIALSKGTLRGDDVTSSRTWCVRIRLQEVVADADEVSALRTAPG